MIFFFNKIILSVFVMLVYFSLFGCRIFFVEGTISILLGVKSMPCIVQFEQESCDVVASRTKSLYNNSNRVSVHGFTISESKIYPGL